MNRTLLLAVAAAMLLVPMAQTAAQSGGQDTIGDTDEITFYGHIFGHGLTAPMPSNTEAPVGENNYGLGTFDWCTPQGSVALIGASQQSCEQNPNHKLALFSTAGPVGVENRVQFAQQGGYAQLHNERGQTKDVLLDTGSSVTASLYLTIDYHAWPVQTANTYGTNCGHPHPSNIPCVWPYWGWDAGIQPDFVVEGTLYQADLGSRTNSSQAPPVQEAIEQGQAEVVANGQWGPAEASTGIPGAPNAMQFDVDLGAPKIDKIDKDKDFFLVYETYSETAAGQVATHSVRWWSGEFFPPTYTMPVKNAFTVERVVPSFAHGKLAILGIMNTPWGSYDVDSESVELEITGPSGSTVQPKQLTRFSDFSVAHGGHFKPVNVTWIWNYQRENLQPGAYEVTVSASNLQNSAAAECTATFTFEENARGLLTAGESESGVCGTQSVDEEDVQDLKQGASDQAGGSDE